MSNAVNYEKPMFMFDNPYGYLVNINHPKIQPLYYRFKKWKKIPVRYPLSDAERFEFERCIINKFGNPTVKSILQELKEKGDNNG